MDTRQIFSYLIGDHCTRDIFLGVFAVDELPQWKIKKDQWCLVVNCCPKYFTGEHWMAIFFNNDHLEFFDSFGLSPKQYSDKLEYFIQIQCPWKERFQRNKFKLQLLSSSACGQYCILYLFKRARNMDKQEGMELIIKEFLEMNRDSFIIHVVSNWYE